MSQGFSQKHKDEEKLVDLLTDKIIEKMLTGEQQDLNMSTASTSGELVKKLIREMEEKGVALDQFVKEEPLQQSQSLSYISMPAGVAKKEGVVAKQEENRAAVKQPVKREERKVEIREEQKEAGEADFMALISKKALHQRKPQPRIDINLEDEKLKLEA